MTKPVYLVDASIYIFRAYFSLPDQWFAPNGFAVNALYGYVQFWFKFLQQTRPTKVVAAYDESLGSCFRNDIYPGYKSSRVLPDEELAFQLQACKGFTDILGIPSPASDRYEADDILATLADQAQRRGEAVTIVSQDKDLGQLLKKSQDTIWDFAVDKRLDQQGLIDQLGVRSDQLVDYLALVGDSVDDIPGVPGIGPKTAVLLLAQFGDIDNLYADLDAVATSGLRGARSFAGKLALYRSQVIKARHLVLLYTGVPLDKRTQSMQWRPPAIEEISDYLHKYGLAGRFRRQMEQSDWWT